MKFTISKSSSFLADEDYEKEINSLEELKQFQIVAGHPIIINFKNNSIEIYDDYRE